MAIDQTRDRKKTLGGSEIATVLGINPYKTVIELWMEKIGMIEPPDLSGKPAIKWGHKLEAAILDEYDAQNDTLIIRDERYVHPKYPFIVGNLDGRDPVKNVVVEAKTVSARAVYQWGRAGTNEVPMWYATQVYYYMWLAGCEFATFAMLCDISDYREYHLMRNETHIKLIEESALKFWEYVEAKKRPPITSYKDVMRLWEPVNKKLHYLTAEDKQKFPALFEAIEKSSIASAQMKDLKLQIDGHKCEISKFMFENDAEKLCIGDQTIGSIVKTRNGGAALRLNTLTEED